MHVLQHGLDPVDVGLGQAEHMGAGGEDGGIGVGDDERIAADVDHGADDFQRAGHGLGIFVDDDEGADLLGLVNEVVDVAPVLTVVDGVAGADRPSATKSKAFLSLRASAA